MLNSPGYVADDFDGLIGWEMLRENVLQIDAVKRDIMFFEEVPKSST